MANSYTVNPYYNNFGLGTYSAPIQYTAQTGPQSPSIVWVQGESGAKAYPVAAGTSMMLMDSETSRFYIKTTDASGIPQPLRIFEYNEITAAEAKPINDYVTRSEFEELKKMIDDLTK